MQDVKYTNIKIVFLPANTTSVLQPLDLGIIQNFKVHYHKLLFRFVLAKIEECTSASEITKSVTILHAIRWVAEAWKRVASDTTKKCFRKAGILTKSFEVVQPLWTSEETDPFADIDNDTEDTDDSPGIIDFELSDLISQLQGSEDACSVNDLVSAECTLPVCSEFAEENWDEEFMTELGPRDKLPCPDEDSESENEDEPARLPSLGSFREAMTSLEEVRCFLEYRGCTSEATDANTLMDSLAELQYIHVSQAARQTAITDFFS